MRTFITILVVAIVVVALGNIALAQENPGAGHGRRVGPGAGPGGHGHHARPDHPERPERPGDGRVERPDRPERPGDGRVERPGEGEEGAEHPRLRRLARFLREHEVNPERARELLRRVAEALRESDVESRREAIRRLHRWLENADIPDRVKRGIVRLLRHLFGERHHDGEGGGEGMEPVG